ncbi:TetR/AcrR family transcriptional regulator [Phreatobacter stygius]|nr:TetR/AcrR family transcriptional regulator [Phreatobacter stygius]
MVNAPRKLPRQARSQSTVDVILDATALLLVAEGFARTTTTRVAERAGVSIGSLYQYFPNREALVRAVEHRRDLALHADIRQTLAETCGQGLRVVLTRGLQTLIRAHGSNLALHQVLAQEAPRFSAMDGAANADAHRYTVTRQALERHRDELRPGFDREAAAFLMPNVIGATITATALARPTAFASGELERELTEMMYY